MDKRGQGREVAKCIIILSFFSLFPSFQDVNQLPPCDNPQDSAYVNNTITGMISFVFHLLFLLAYTRPVLCFGCFLVLFLYLLFLYLKPHLFYSGLGKNRSFV